MILEGRYNEGELLPTERDLARSYKMSRVTVRKALDLMEQEEIIRRVQGRGTVVTYRRDGYSGSMEIIALVGTISTTFFNTFLKTFESHAEKKDSLVVFKEDFQGSILSAKGGINALVRKGIRNLVLWPHHRPLHERSLVLARGMGCNIVIFDETSDNPFADSLGLDNKHAVKILCDDMHRRGISRIDYAGWSGLPISSTLEREGAFKRTENGRIHHCSWDNRSGKDIARIVQSIKNDPPPGIICGNGDIALELRREFIRAGGGLRRIKVSCIDDLPEMNDLGITALSQPMEDFGKEAYRLLRKQFELGSRWQPGVVRLKGRLIERS
jgi:DNA-binding LacI/PurR family transcriptional regulator